MNRPVLPSRGEAVRDVLGKYVSRMTAQSIVRAALHRSNTAETAFERIGLDAGILDEMRRGIALYLPDDTKKAECLARLSLLLPGARASHDGASSGVPSSREVARAIEIRVHDENGIVDARTRARALAADIGFRSTEQYKLATAVSELSRNIFRYAGRGQISLTQLDRPRKGMMILAKDEGPGIADLAAVLSETYRSKTGLGRGLQGCKKIMDEFNVDTAPGRGTTVMLRKYL